MTDPTYTVGDYLLDRLAELGLREVFGVPGDFNLEFLDHVTAHDTLRWVGNANELNAGYAADGYARLKGIGALVTTFGVGELSAANAIAGSYAEHVPVVHIVGAPSKDAQAARRPVHHSLGDGDFEHFVRVAREFTCAQANLVPATATREIDRVLAEVHQQKLPGYLVLSTDVARFPAEPPTTPLPSYAGASSPRALSLFTEAAAKLVGDNTPTVLADLLVHRLGEVDTLQNLLTKGNLPYATLMWGKSLLDESAPGYRGIYAGAASDESARAAVEDAPALILAGVEFTDMVSGFFSQQIDADRTIDIRAHESRVAGKVFAPLEMHDALEALSGIVASGTQLPVEDELPTKAVTVADADGTLTQEVLWDKVAGALTPGNVVLADQGTSFYGMAAHRLPTGVTFVGQPLWASIGYTLPAALGAGLAQPDRRVVLLVGDGAAQLTVQELGSFEREGLAPVVILVNNDGYTIERAIHGQQAYYNDIVRWDWQALPAALGAGKSTVLRAATPAQLDTALAQAAQEDTMTVVEVVVDVLDLPELLGELAQSAAAANQDDE